MNILLVCWYFPPANTIAAVRLGRLAEYLLRNGHDVRVISARDIPFPATLEVDIPADKVVYAPWFDVDALPRAVARWVSRPRGRGSASGSAARVPMETQPIEPPANQSNQLRRVLKKISAVYSDVVAWPDRQIGWLPAAVLAGRKISKTYRADFVLASGPPFTTLLIGLRLSKSIGIPLIVELRDRWSDDPYYPPAKWRQTLNRWAENAILRRALGIVTVSEPWAESYRRRFGRPTTVVYNGYDAALLDRIEKAGLEADLGDQAGGNGLQIVYTGGIYPGRRDPSKLFEAISQLQERAELVQVEFYGTSPDMVWPIARRFGVVDNVRILPAIPHDESLRIQRRADVLLLMQWDDPKEQGNVPGKFFEYLGARRPILVLGLEDGVPASLVRERHAGVFGKSPDQIAGQLEEWLRIKESCGAIPDTSEASRSNFSRDEQYSKLVSFLQPFMSGR